MKEVIKGILSAIVALAMLSSVSSCGGNEEEQEAAAKARERELELAQLSETLRPNHHFKQPYEWKLDSMPPGGRKILINSVGGTLGRVFNDSNHLQINASKAVGIRPILGPEDVWHARKPLVKIESNRDYYVDELRHSMPYLVPEAARLLQDIGRGFNDSLASRGGGAYRIKVTSVLRTPVTVKKLRRRNVNAVATSAHLYGTTFDISYAKFICDSDTLPRTQEDLKNLLAEVLHNLRKQNRCYVKYERKQACFHITARPQGSHSKK